MNGSKEASPHLGFTTTFVGILVFSTLATEVFLVYLSLRGRSITFWEAIPASVIIGIFFSGLGERITKIQNSSTWVIPISVFTNATYYRLFIDQRIISSLIFIELIGYAMFSFVYGGWFLSVLLPIGKKYLKQREISRKVALKTVGSLLVILLFGYIAYSYQQTVISFFDSHPWIIGLIGIVVSTIVGVIVGRRTKH